VTQALGDGLYAEQLEVIWQFKRFAQGTSSPAINETTKAAILTLNESGEAPRRIVGEYTGEEHYLGWKEDHFRKFLDKYNCFSHMETEDCVRKHDPARWVGRQMPKWLSAAEISTFFQPPISALDRSLQDIITAVANKSTAKNTAKHGRGFAGIAYKGKLSQSTGSHSRSTGSHRAQANKKVNPKVSSAKASRPDNISAKDPGTVEERAQITAKTETTTARNAQSCLPPTFR
jgi:hypothetical protein